MPDKPHMRPDLVRAAGFEFAFNQAHIAETLEDFVMCNSMFTGFTIGINLHFEPVFFTATDMDFNPAFILVKISPNLFLQSPL